MLTKKLKRNGLKKITPRKKKINSVIKGMSEISDLASGIFTDEFDSDTGIATSGSIQAWLENNLGELNNLIYKFFQQPSLH